jgi:hypothetical protein
MNKLYRYNDKELKFEKINVNYFRFKVFITICLFFILVSFANKTQSVSNSVKEKIKIVTNFDTTPLTKENVLEFIHELDIKYSNIVYKQVMLETSNLTSKICIENNNLVGQRVEATNLDGTYRYPHYNIKKITNRGHLVFANWKLSLIHYKAFQEYNFLNKDQVYYNFLKSLGYAEDPNYINALKTQ